MYTQYIPTNMYSMLYAYNISLPVRALLYSCGRTRRFDNELRPQSERYRRTATHQSLARGSRGGAHDRACRSARGAIEEGLRRPRGP